MGRHTAPIAVIDGFERDRPSGPITDPRLFDRPVAARPRGEAATFAPLRVEPQVTELLPVPSSTPAGRVDTYSASPDRPEVETRPFRPVAVRPSAPAALEPVVPRRGGGRLSFARADSHQTRVRYARTGPVDIIATGPTPIAPSAFRRRREAAVAAAALAVVGAMSGAAALLPTGGSDAEAATKIDPVAAPMPVASGSTSDDGRTCISPGTLKRAMRSHHLQSAVARRAVQIVTPASVEGTAGSTPTPSTTSTPTPTTSSRRDSASPSSAPSQVSSGSSTSGARVSASASTLPIPDVVGSLLRAVQAALGAGTYALRDFASQSSGAVVSGVVKGEGVGKTVVAMTSNTSTKAGSVPGNGNNQGGLANPVNPLYLLRGVNRLEDVTIQGTPQGHLYNGVYLSGSNIVVRHVAINDIPGNSYANPGETFALNVNRATGTNTVDDLTINGGTGALSSAAGFAINNSDSTWNISDLTARNLKWSAGIALWQVRGTMNIHDYVQSGGPRSLGAERMAGTVNLYDPKWSAGTSGHDVTYTWDGGYSGGRINFYYSSASKVPDRKIQIITNHASGIAGSVHVYIGGVQQKTSDYVTIN